MFEIDLFLVMTHTLAFVAGAACIIIFNSIMDRGSRQKSKVIGAAVQHRTLSTSSQQKPISQPTTEPEQIKEQSVVETTTQPEQKKLSAKQLRNLQRKEDNARKRQEELERKAALAEAKRKATFDPCILKPENVKYTDLSVVDGKLVPWSLGKTSYYHYWEYDGRYFFEFSCEKSKVAKAINNRSAVIDPFCQKDSSSVAVDAANDIITDKFGELDSELNVISKSTIIYQ